MIVLYYFCRSIGSGLLSERSSVRCCTTSCSGRTRRSPGCAPVWWSTRGPCAAHHPLPGTVRIRSHWAIVMYPICNVSFAFTSLSVKRSHGPFQNERANAEVKAEKIKGKASNFKESFCFLFHFCSMWMVLFGAFTWNDIENFFWLLLQSIIKSISDIRRGHYFLTILRPQSWSHI